MRAITVELYKINELPAQIKKKALEKYRCLLIEDGFYYDHERDYFTEKLNELGFLEPWFEFKHNWYKITAKLDYEKLLEQYPKKELLAPMKHDLFQEGIDTVFTDEQSKLVRDFENWIEEYKRDLEIEFENNVNAAERFETSDERLIEHFTINDVEFTEKGEIYG